MAAQAISVQQHVQGRWQIVRLMLALNVVALFAMYLSGHWDAAEHAKGAVDRFWYPPHFGIYFSILAAGLLAAAGLAVLLWRAPELPFTMLRRNGPLLLVVVANALAFTGAPFDAWWHVTFGIDLTVWSPPHLHILIGQTLAALGCIVYFLDDAPRDMPLRTFAPSDLRRTALALMTFLVALLLAAFLFLEYEGGVRSRDVLARAAWSYPVVWTAFVLLTFALIAGSTRRVGLATLVAGAYVVARALMLWFDRAVLDYSGIGAFPLVVPALAFDLVLLLGQRRAARPWPGLVLGAGLATTVVVMVTTPLYWSWLDVAPELTVAPWRSYWAAALVTGLLATAAGWGCGTWLRALRPERSPKD